MTKGQAALQKFHQDGRGDVVGQVGAYRNAALGKRGIDLYLYYTGDGPYKHKEIGGRFGFTEPRNVGVTRPFVEKWASVLEEYAVRYGENVKGWWIDGCYAGFLKYNDDLLALSANAIWKGNPKALVAMNNGVRPYFAKHYSGDDFTCRTGTLKR